LKISNETKVGALTVICVALLILGFNLLKGKNLFSRNTILYAKYDNVQGLATGNYVRINGLAVGSVSSLQVMDKEVGQILVRLSIQKGLNIPRNSVASIISSDLLGTKAVRIDFGSSNEYLQNGDTIRSDVERSITQSLTKEIKPLSGKVQVTLGSLDSVLSAINHTLDENTQRNLRASIAGLHATMQNMQRVSVSLNELLGNLNDITANLKQNGDKINRIMDNAEKTTAMLAGSHLDETLNGLNNTVDQLNGIIAKANSTDGTLGLLLNDKKLYNNLQATTRNLNLLMEDLRLNPKRYVHFSIFGKKSTPQPLPSDTLK
jgi:phospholipid/cholesterol/gamma-HCH transport system substrate-binding protein